MDIDPPQRAPRKHAFAPKKLGARRKKPIQTKLDESVVDDKADENDEIPEHLIRRVNEHLTRERPKAEKKAKEVAFIHGSTDLRTYGKPREDSVQRDGAASKGPGLDNRQNLLSLPKTAEMDGVTESSETHANVLSLKKKEYKEPWDYHHSYYPITLPLRRPYSGDPELLDKAEFGESKANMKYYDENSICAASDLGLLEGTVDPRMMFLQLPGNLPITRLRTPSIGECSLEELPRGYIGKMLVYKSGVVKLKVGEILYDASPGSECTFAQDVVAVNTIRKHCCQVGELRKRAVVSPDIDFLLDHVNR